MLKAVSRGLWVGFIACCLLIGGATSGPSRDASAAGPAGAASRSGGQALLEDQFGSRPEGLVTNEYAYRHPAAAEARADPIWELTSGSLFAHNGHGYTGIPDHLRPNAASSNGTNSAVFRCRTRRADFGNVAVEFDLLDVALYDHTGVAPNSYDGVHVWLRYQSEYELYAVTINRRDNQVEIKKKTPGGPSNGGTYITLAHAPYLVPFGTWQHVRATARNRPNHSVTIELWIDGRRRVNTTDTGAGGAPTITHPGRVGVRGDNCEFSFDHFTVMAH